MPARDGTGPSGHGPHTGRGMGNCVSTSMSTIQPLRPGLNPSFHWGGRIWHATIGRLFLRRRANHANRR